MVTRAEALRWVADYETAWRTRGTQGLGTLFAERTRYRHSPYSDPLDGLEAIEQMWEAEREGPEEVFSLETRVVATDADTAVVRARVLYGSPVRQEYTDLWVIEFDAAGRCISFEEWPFWPGKPWSASD